MDGQRDLELVPTVRLGRVLETARADRGFDLDRVAEQTNHHFSPQALSAIEGGRLRLERGELEMLSEIYGVRSGELIPDRGELVIDLAGGTLAAGVHQRQLGEAVDDPDEVLIQYLSLVYAMRDIPPGQPIPLRDLDLEVLSEALVETTASLETQLKELMANPDDSVGQRSRRLRRRLVVPAAGILVGATAVGVLVMIQSGSEPAPATGEVEIGDAVVVEPGEAPEVRTGMAPEVEATPAAGIMGEVALIPPMVIKRGQDGQIVEVTPGNPLLIPPLVIEGPDGEDSAGTFD